jgi:hypothetical protein
MIDSLLDGAPMPISLADELSPTRWVVRAHFRESLSILLYWPDGGVGFVE